MPYTTEWQDKTFSAHFTGTLNYSDLRQCDLEQENHQNFDDIRYSIWDFTDIDSANLSTDDIEILDALDHGPSKTNPRLNVLIVVDKEELMPLAEIYKQSIEDLPWEVYVFEKPEQAFAWKESEEKYLQQFRA